MAIPAANHRRAAIATASAALLRQARAGAAGDQDRDQADPTGAADPLAALLDQVLADLDAGEVTRARATVAAIRARI